MASIRKLKKDIDFLTQEVVETIMIKLYFVPETKSQELLKMAEDFVDYRDNVIKKINKPELKEEAEKKKKKLKSYYNEIFETFMAEVNKAFEDLNKIKDSDSSK